MIYNYHTHTKRCGHAHGSDEEFIQDAIEAGIKHLGFSDHAPFIFPDGYESSYRMPMSQAKEYVEDLKVLREKYKDQIQISIGLEMEYYSDHFGTMLKTARNIGAEYLILGQHFIRGEHPDGVGSGGPTENSKFLSIYVDEVIEAMKTGFFTYVAHPDMMAYNGDVEFYRKEIARICLASRELNIPLEINLAGVRYNKFYPFDEFWKIAGEIGAPVTIGYDAHLSEDFLNKHQLDSAAELIKNYKLNYIGMPILRSIK